MNSATSGVADLLACGKARGRSVKDRIERRLDVLRLWLAEGVPEGKLVPSSLTAAREWHDEELGIWPIKSPNDFTKSRSPYRKEVADIAGLITLLRARYTKASRATSRKNPPTSKFDSHALERELSSIASKWHSERSARLQEKDRADAAQARSVQLLEENARLESLIVDLRRQLTSRQSLKVVE